MAKNRGRQDEYTSVIYGIHMETLAVQTVWVSRNGTMSMGTGMFRHAIVGDRTPLNEAFVVFNLLEAEEVPIALSETSGKRAQERLEKRAEEMRAERAAKQQEESAKKGEGDAS